MENTIEEQYKTERDAISYANSVFEDKSLHGNMGNGYSWNDLVKAYIAGVDQAHLENYRRFDKIYQDLLDRANRLHQTGARMPTLNEYRSLFLPKFQ